MFTMRLSKRSLGTLLSAAALVLLAACPDPQGRFDEFVERSAASGKGGTGGTAEGKVADLNGRFLLSIATNLDPSKPLLFETDVTMTLGPNDTCPSGTCKLGLKIQPLSNAGNPRAVKDHCPAPFEPVGDVIEIEGVDVDLNGDFRAEFHDETVPGCANPISGGQIKAPLLVLISTTLSKDLFCGPVEGNATSPTVLDLKGSTFAAQRLGATEKPGDVTAPPSRCPAVTGTGGTGGAAGSGGAGGTGS